MGGGVGGTVCHSEDVLGIVTDSIITGPEESFFFPSVCGNGDMMAWCTSGDAPLRLWKLGCWKS